MTTVSPVRTTGRARLSPAYLTIWAVLAALALAYLSLLAIRPDLADSLTPGPGDTAPEGNRGQRAMSRALADIKDLRQTVALLERELTDLRTAVTVNDARDAVVTLRIAALESGLKTALATAASRSAPVAGEAGQKPTPPAVHGFIEERPTKEAREGRPGEPPRTAASAAGAAARPAAPAGPPVGVQLAAGPSVDALRLSWQLLQENHKSALRSLEPRFIEATGEPSAYRLIAGPIATSEDAQRICERLKTRRVTCSVQPFTGSPL